MQNQETNNQLEESTTPVEEMEKLPAEAEEQPAGPSEIVRSLQQAEQHLSAAVDDYAEKALAPIGQAYRVLIEKSADKILSFVKQIKIAPADHVIDEAILTIIQIDGLIKKQINNPTDDLSNELASAFDDWKQTVAGVQKDIPDSVSYSFSADKLKASPDDHAAIRRYKSIKRFLRFGRSEIQTTVPLRDIFHHYFLVAITPEMHKELGEFLKSSYEITNALRNFFSRQLKLLVISLDKTTPSEQTEIISERIAAFETNIQELVAQADKLHEDFRSSLKKSVKEAFQNATTLAVNPGAARLLRYRDRRINETSLDVLKSRMQKFPELWQVNQQAYYRQLQADLWFGRISLTVFRLSRGSRIKVEREFFHPVEQNIQAVEQSLQSIQAALQKKKAVVDVQEISLNDQLYLSADGMINRLENTTDAVAQILPESFELLHIEEGTSAFSYTRKLPTTRIALSRIADYLIKTNFTENHRKELVEMSQKMKQLNNQIINSANLIIYSQEVANEDQNQQGMAETITKTESELAEVKSALEKVKAQFTQQLAADQNNALASLDVKAVVTRADQLQQYVNREPTERPVNRWMEKKMRGANNLWRKLGLFIVRRRHDVVVARHHKKHEELINDGERIQNFVESIKLSPEINQQLPYYYKQLFSGKHLSNAAGVRIRKNEISQARKIIQRIQRGAGGALAITGDAMTGITFLTNYISTQLINGKVYRINAPVGGAHRAADLHQAIMDQLGKKRGNVISSLASLETGSVFIFHDLEQWWLKHPNGNEAILALTQLIERFGRKFYFLITCNSFSFRLISKVGSLENYLTSTIVIAPATLDEMREIIWLRHTTGGMDVELGGKKAENLYGSQWDNLLKKFYKRSNGNIGLALHFWLRSIIAVKEDTVVVEDTGLETFPSITNSSWKVLIYQLFLHRSLSITRIKLMFEDEDPQWLRQNLNALIRFGLVEETGRHSYALNVMCRPYIERWFNDLKLIS